MTTTTKNGLTALAVEWAEVAFNGSHITGDPVSAYLDLCITNGHAASDAWEAFNAAFDALRMPVAAERAGYVTVDALLDDPAPRDVLVEPLIPRHQVTAFVGAKESGKSWLAMQIGMALATGRPVLGSPAQDPMDVLYLDWENAKPTQSRRLRALGYEKGQQDGSRFHYASYPSAGSITTKDGADEILGWVRDTNAKFVIVDTLSRAFQGEVTNADVNQAWIHFVMPLKRMEDVTLLWLDHTGHDGTRARDASTKGQLWEMEWLMSRDYSLNQTNLLAHKDREGWFSQRLTLSFEDGGFTVWEPPAPDEAMEFARQMERAKCPRDMGKDKVREYMKDRNHTVPRAAVVQQAITWRKRNQPEALREPSTGSEPVIASTGSDG